MQASFIRLDLPEYFRLNQTIHRRVVEAAGNPVLAQTHESLNVRLLRARYLASQTDRDRWAAAMREHELIIDALSRRAAEEIAQLLREHLWHKDDTIRTNFDRL
jgi:DNA-binding GntR family transcriptional regulator